MQTNADIIKSFINNAEAVSAFIYEKETLKDAVTKCIEICEEKKKKILAVPDPEIAELFEESSLEILSDEIYEKRDLIEAGFTKTDAAIAATGSIVINSSNENLRIATMLSDIHIAVVKKSQIVKTSSDLSEKLKKDMGDASNYTAFITGPSRTADIERTLAIGVHGPLELHLVVLED